ncbi:uncharacterized protein LOC143071044 [Mytilus galloprovincialis]|uniref:uncharacterized protein LOC143071044 n=1 Tax=Mytilus galloprovincialis TaxID=29158 RepID=UPI003F7BD220
MHGTDAVNDMSWGRGFKKKAVFNDMSTKTMEENATLETLLEIYKRADSWTFQQQILTTIVKDKELQDVQKLIPGLTRYKFKQAKEHIDQFGVGEPVTTKKLSREKYTVSQLDHFIDFITSGQIVKDQPFGEKTLKMESGEVIIIPTVIQSLTPSSIISQYVFLWNEENVKPLGPCDRHASHIKPIIRRYINQGNDVTSALHMKQLYNFQYFSIGLRMWKAYAVGEGKM